MIFDTKIAGIPCQCKVLAFAPYKHMQITGSGFGDAEPPEYPEFDFELLDRKGYPAPWLEAKLTSNDSDRLLEESQLEALGERYGYL